MKPSKKAGLFNRLKAWLLRKKTDQIYTYRIEVEWCDEDEVFIASSPDIDGLILEAETADEMMKYLRDIVPILLEENGTLGKNEIAESLIYTCLQGALSDIAMRKQRILH